MPLTDLEAAKPARLRRLLAPAALAAFLAGAALGALLVLRARPLPLPARPPHVSFVPPPARAAPPVDGVYWSPAVDARLPPGFTGVHARAWRRFLAATPARRLEKGCGRMQNRRATFADGSQACVRYRQNTDQIQGELFSFYLGRALNLRNLAPSAVAITNFTSELFGGVAAEAELAGWGTQKAVVLTQFVPNLAPALIPNDFRPVERHLNRHDVLNATRTLNELVELAQWSDLIIFDYLTANLDRIVNNLYNYQWNANIMDAPAHNLAKRDDNLLVFLDNESGLLHGYRLLKKYEAYHRQMLEGLCVFRRETIETIRELIKKRNVGEVLRGLFEGENSERVRDLLPGLPDKSVKILNERLDAVDEQVVKCEAKFART